MQDGIIIVVKNTTI